MDCSNILYEYEDHRKYITEFYYVAVSTTKDMVFLKCELDTSVIYNIITISDIKILIILNQEDLDYLVSKLKHLFNPYDEFVVQGLEFSLDLCIENVLNVQENLVMYEFTMEEHELKMKRENESLLAIQAIKNIRDQIVNDELTKEDREKEARRLKYYKSQKQSVAPDLKSMCLKLRKFMKNKEQSIGYFIDMIVKGVICDLAGIKDITPTLYQWKMQVANLLLGVIEASKYSNMTNELFRLNRHYTSEHENSRENIHDYLNLCAINNHDKKKDYGIVNDFVTSHATKFWIELYEFVGNDKIYIERARFIYLMRYHILSCRWMNFDRTLDISNFMVKHHETFSPLYQETMILILMARSDPESLFFMLPFEHINSIIIHVLDSNI